MGPKERRAMTEVEKNNWPAWKKQINAAARFEVPIEIRWDMLAVDGHENMYVEGVEKVFVKPLVKMFEDICRDDMGRKAFQEKVKKIVIRNTESLGITYKNGELIFDYNPVTNLDDSDERAERLLETLNPIL